MSETTLERTRASVTFPRAATGFGRWLRNPWRRPVFLKGVTWGYLAWSILPVVIAIVFSFNAGRSRSTWQGFSLRWWWEDPEDSLWRDPALRAALSQSVRLSLLTMLFAVPMGTLFAIGLDRWRGRPASASNFAMLFSFVIPEIVLGVSLFLVVTFVLKEVLNLGTTAQVIGLVTYQLSYPVIIVRARLLSIGKEYEEAAMDLGAKPSQAIRWALLPLLYPAVFASFALVFADSIDDFVTVRYLCGAAACEPLSVKIYGAARAAPTPAVNAAATFMLVATLLAITIGVLLYRFAARGQRRAKESGVESFVSFEV